MNPGVKVVSYRNSTSNHNIDQELLISCIVVSYRNSTSNHNFATFTDKSLKVVSYRNSTSNHNNVVAQALMAPLYLIEILHQTTTCSGTLPRFVCCILSKFYIKPQRRVYFAYVFYVVSYRNSTSNHNEHFGIFTTEEVVSYRNSTSNHNLSSALVFRILVVSYRNSTSNHNKRSSHNIGHLVVSYRNSTSNHNVGPHID